MPTVISLQWPKTGKRISGDFLFADVEHPMWGIADGVTRVNKNEHPPQDAEAARLFLRTMMHEALCIPRIPECVTTAFRRGNDVLRRHNQELGFWGEGCDYGVRDMAGAVAALAMIYNGTLIWGYMTDCFVAHLSPTDFWITTDDLKPVRDKHFPTPPHPLSHEETIAEKIHNSRTFRNKPELGLENSFGVLTGEETALKYVLTGERKVKPGDVVTVGSDGIRTFVDNAANNALLRTGSKEDIEAAILASGACDNDDVSLIIIRW